MNENSPQNPNEEPVYSRLTLIAKPLEVETLLRDELSMDEFSSLKIEQATAGQLAIRPRPSGEQISAEMVISFVAVSAASGVTWDIMKKVYVVLRKRFGDNAVSVHNPDGIKDEETEN